MHQERSFAEAVNVEQQADEALSTRTEKTVQGPTEQTEKAASSATSASKEPAAIHGSICVHSSAPRLGDNLDRPEFERLQREMFSGKIKTIVSAMPIGKLPFDDKIGIF